MRTTTTDSLTQDLRRSLCAQGVVPPGGTFGEFIAACYARGVTLGDQVDSIEYCGRSGKLWVERDPNGVSIGEERR